MSEENDSYRDEKEEQEDQGKNIAEEEEEDDIRQDEDDELKDDDFDNDEDSDDSEDDNGEHGDDDGDEDNNEENSAIASINEEDLLEKKLDEVEFGKLITAKAKLDYQSKYHHNNNNNPNKKPKSKQEILNKLQSTNKGKKKNEPKEFSALIKPKYQMKTKPLTNLNNNLLNRKYHRDPRFDDMSGTLNQDRFEKNFGFVKDMAGEYIDKINKFKKSKKNKKKISQDDYALLKKQTNYVKGWLNHQKQLDEKKEVHQEINKENKKRMQEGKKPIYVKDNAIKKYIKNKKEEDQE